MQANSTKYGGPTESWGAKSATNNASAYVRAGLKREWQLYALILNGARPSCRRVHSERLAIITDTTGRLRLQLGIPNGRKGQLLSETYCRNVRRQNSGRQWECLDVCVCVCVCVCGTCTHLWKLPRIHKGPGEIRVMREAMRCLFLQCKLWEMLCEWRLSWIWLHWGGYLVELFTMKCNSASGNEAVFFFFFLLHSWSIVETVSSRLETNMCIALCLRLRSHSLHERRPDRRASLTVTPRGLLQKNEE